MLPNLRDYYTDAALVESLSHRRNGETRQIPQTLLKCLSIALHIWVVFRSLCCPNQDVDNLFYSEPLRRSSNLVVLLNQPQKSCEASLVLQVEIADIRPGKFGESFR